MGGERWAAGSDGGVLGVTPRRAAGIEFSNHKTTHVNVSGTRGTDTKPLLALEPCAGGFIFLKPHTLLVPSTYNYNPVQVFGSVS